MRTIAIIPAYNEQDNIEKVVMATEKFVDKVLVIDDSSEDSTLQILKKLNVEYLLNETNKGNSYSILSGFQYAIHNNFDTIISIDADFAHNPNEIPFLLDTLYSKECSFVIGNRFNLNSDVPTVKRYANFFATSLFNILTATKQKDVACGFRAFRKEFISAFIENNKSIGFQIVYDELLFAVRNKLKIAYNPISVNYNACELLSTKKNEFIDLIDFYINIGSNNIIQEKLFALKDRILKNNSFMIKINHVLLCIIAIKESNSFVFQKQNAIFNSNKLPLYDFDEL